MYGGSENPARIVATGEPDGKAALRKTGDPVPRMRWFPASEKGGGAYAPPFPNFQTGMPSFLALSAKLSWMPVPGKTMTPIGRMSSI